MNSKNNIVLAKLLLLIFLFTGFAGFAQDQQVIKYSLEEVIKIAQKQSPDAMKARHSFRSSYWSYRTYKAKYLPNLTLGAEIPDINRSISAIASQDGSISYTSQNSNSYSVNLSMTQLIGFTGGQVFVTTGLSRLDDNNVSDADLSTQYLSNMVSVGISQPIFSYNEYKWLKKIEPLEYEAARRELIEENEAVASTAVAYFFDLLIYQLEKGIALKNYQNYDTLYKIAKGRFELGKIAENDLLQLELNLLTATADLEISELNYENSSFVFKSYLRLKDDVPIELIPPSYVPDFKISPEIAIDNALNNTSSGIDFKQRLLEAESAVDKARKEGRFDAELYAVFGLSQTAYNFNDAYKNPLDEEQVSLGITIPILDWGVARGEIKIAESEQDLVITDVEQDIIDFNQNVFINVMEFNMQKNQLFIAAKSDTVAQKRYEVTQKRYMIGKINDVLELKNAQVDNDNAKVGYYSALMEYWQSYYEIRELTLYDFLRNRPITIDYESLLD